MLRRAFLVVLFPAVFCLPIRAADIENLLPEETEFVVQVNVNRVLESGLVKKFALGQMKQMLEGNDAQKMIKKIGLDPMKDVAQITFGSWGAGDKEEMNLAFTIRGKFDPEKLLAAAKEEAKNKDDADKISIREEEGRKIIKFKLDKQPKPFYMQILDTKTIVGGTDQAWVIGAKGARKDKPKYKKELLTLLENQDEKACIFAAGVGTGKEKIEIPNGIPGIEGEKLAKQLQNVRTITFTIRMSDDIELSMNAGMKDKDSAEDFGETISQFITLAKGFLPLMTQQQPKAKALVDEVNKTLVSKVKESDVVVGLKISSESIGKLMGTETEDKEEKMKDKEEDKEEKGKDKKEKE